MLRVDAGQANKWSEATVIHRWKRIYRIPEVVKQYLKNPDAVGIREVAQDIIEEWRQRLMDISWMMRCLNEYLARKANIEDNCKGRFWEGRFKSQPLLDEAAVLTAMSYVDLNPVRAKMAKTPENSNFTSIQQRIQKRQKKPTDNQVPLVKLSASKKQSHPNTIAFSEKDYLQLVDWAGRAILPKKRGAIDSSLPPILERLNINPEGFIELIQKTDDLSGLTALGSTTAVTHYIERIEQKFIKGLSLNQRVFT